MFYVINTSFYIFSLIYLCNKINNSIETALSQYLSSLSYNSIISFSSIANSVLSVAGVSSARVSTSSDNSVFFGIQSVNIDGTLQKTYTTDILLANNQLPSLYSLNITAFGVNNF